MKKEKPLRWRSDAALVLPFEFRVRTFTLRWPKSHSDQECLELSEKAYEAYCQKENFFPILDRYTILKVNDAEIVALGVILK